MHAAVDEKYSSYYAYDHSGERRVKLTGTNDLLDVNADYMYTASVLKEPTIYPSAYMVMSNRGYTSISPYAYCAWNPVKLVDPDGRDIYRLDAESGSLMLYKKNKKNYDVIEVGTTNKIGRATLFNKKSEKRISKGILEGKENQDISQTGFVTCSNRQEEALEVAVFISFSCHKELSGVGYEGIMRNQDLEVFAWASNTSNHSDNPVHYSPSKGGESKFHFHTHCGNKNGKGGYANPGTEDKNTSATLKKTSGINTFVIISKRGCSVLYDENGKKSIYVNSLPKSVHSKY